MVLETATKTFVSLFDNPWLELEFTYVNTKDNFFTADEDRHLLCWANKYGYGQWDAVKMAIRRSPEFRFDYYLRSLQVDVIGRRCEQLMKAAEKEIEIMTKKVKEDAGLIEDEKKDVGLNDSKEGKLVPEVSLPRFKEVKQAKRRQAEEEIEIERKQLEGKVEDIESQMEEIQNRLAFLQKCSKDLVGTNRRQNQTDFPDDMLPELANIVAKSGHAGVMAITNEFVAEYGQPVSKKVICAKIEDIANKERRREEGDLRAVWHVLPEYMSLLTVDTIRYLRKQKESRLEKKRGGSRKRKKNNNDVDEDNVQNENGAIGPDGDFVKFPDYDGTEEPRECKKAFTLFCTATRKEVKKSLDPDSRRDRDKVNKLLKQKWFNMSEEDRDTWKKWQVWDNLRFQRDLAIHDRVKKGSPATHGRENFPSGNDERNSIPKKRKDPENSHEKNESATNLSFHIPKKKR